MLQSAHDAQGASREGQPVLGWGWKEVETFDDLEDLDEYESDEEDVYVVMDLGGGITNKALLAENSYQLVGIDTPLPFLKLGNQVFQGEAVEMIGDEIIFGRIRNEEDPHAPDRPPLHSTSLHLSFRPVAPSKNPPPHQTAATSVHFEPLDAPSTSNAHQSSPFVFPRAPPLRRPSRSGDAAPGPSNTSAQGGGITTTPKKVGRPKGSKSKPRPSGDLQSAEPLFLPSDVDALFASSNQPVTSSGQGSDRLGGGTSIGAIDHTPARTIMDSSAEAGPSQPRQSPQSSAQAALLTEPGVRGEDSLESAQAAYAVAMDPGAPGGGFPLRKSDGKYIIATSFDLSILDVNTYPPNARFVMSQEVEKFLNPVTTMAHARDIAARGYTPNEIAQLLAGRPMRGQGSRLPRASSGRRKSKGKEADPKEDNADVEMAEAGHEEAAE